jgi:hypothetical protein
MLSLTSKHTPTAWMISAFRIELHDALWPDYDTLHAAMEHQGFSRLITGDDGRTYQLPWAEYDGAGKKAGSRLYTHFDLDHEELFRVTSTLAGDFLMTYDDAAGVRDLARKHGFKMRTIAMKNTHHAQMKELLIGRNLDWVGTQTSKVVD